MKTKTFHVTKKESVFQLSHYRLAVVSRIRPHVKLSAYILSHTHLSWGIKCDKSNSIFNLILQVNCLKEVSRFV